LAQGLPHCMAAIDPLPRSCETPMSTPECQ
jgi:hypothetical protein